MSVDDLKSEDGRTSTPVSQSALSDVDAARRQAKFQRDWQEVRARLAELKRLDPSLIRKGATSTRYEFSPPVSGAQIEVFEKKLGAPLPAELAYFYTTIGNGGVGPFGGLYSIDALDLFALDEDEYGSTRREMLEEDNERLHFPLVKVTEHAWSSYESGTNYVLVSCGGPGDGSVSVFQESSHCLFGALCDSLADLYLLWIEHELAMLEVARKLILASDDLIEVWERSDEVFAAEQAGWRKEVLAFRDEFYIGERWPWYGGELQFLEWIGCVLGEDLADQFCTGHQDQLDLNDEALQACFQAARQRYLASR